MPFFLMRRLAPLSLVFVLVFHPARTFAYPASVALTSDVAFAAILADIPFLSVGLVGFGVYTFFFVMRRLNRVTTYIHISVLFAFIAAIFDLSQILRRGYWNMTYGLDVSSVEVLIILREISHALSFGMRYLFFWAFVQEPPRGELPFVPMQDDRRPNFISLSSDSVVHSGDWARLKLVGIFLKWVLLLLAVAVLVLQMLWRLVNAFRTLGPIYVTEAGIEIGLSVAFILKLVVNTFLSPLAPRWHTLRDYSPIILALLFGIGVAIGNLLCFKFTESTLGRFFQAVELYILIIFVLVSAFYKMPVRTSVVAELVRRRLTAAGYGDLENAGTANNRQSQPSMIQAPYSMPQTMGASLQNDSKRMDVPSRPSFTERFSSSSIFSSRLMARRCGSGQSRVLGNIAANDEGDQRRLWDKNNPHPSPSPNAQGSFRNSLDNTPQQTPTVAMREAPGWSDPVLTSVMPDMRSEPSNLSLAGTKGKERDTLVPQIVVPDDASQYTADRNSTPMPTLPLYSRDVTESPIYGLDGIIRNLQQSGAVKPLEEGFLSERSSGIESLLRQQAELDKSIAGLRRFSTTSGNRATPSRMQSESLQSDISLSNFPDPPALARSPPSEGSMSVLSTGLRPIDEASVPETEVDRSKSMAISAISDNSMIVDDVQFQLVPPRMPAAMAETPGRGQNQSVPTISRDSLDSVLQDSGRAVRLDSQGTQYDVTSFIGGLTTPAVAGHRDSPQLTDISEQDRSDASSGNNDPGTIAGATRVQVIEKGRPSEDTVPDSGIGEDSSSSVPDFAPPAPAPTVIEAKPPSQSQPQAPRPQLVTGGKLSGPGRGRGLPTGPRGRLEISNPIRRSSSVLNDRNAFQRPRPAPLVLQNANDNRPAAPEAPRNGGYF